MNEQIIYSLLFGLVSATLCTIAAWFGDTVVEKITNAFLMMLAILGLVLMVVMI